MTILKFGILAPGTPKIGPPANRATENAKLAEQTSRIRLDCPEMTAANRPPIGAARRSTRRDLAQGDQIRSDAAFEHKRKNRPGHAGDAQHDDR